MTHEKEAGNPRQLALEATRPAPWFWKTFPTPSLEGRDFRWHYYGTEGDYAYLVTLEDAESRDTLMLVDAGVRSFPANPGYLGIWYPNDTYDTLLVDIYDIAALKPVEDFEKKSRDFKAGVYGRVLAAVVPMEQVTISDRLNPGNNIGPVAHQADTLDELLLLGMGSGDPRDYENAPAACIYSWQPATGKIMAMPLNWFTASRYDLGYQWIAAVARDPVTHHIVGTGMRMQPFELSENGSELLGWL